MFSQFVSLFDRVHILHANDAHFKHRLKQNTTHTHTFLLSCGEMPSNIFKPNKPSIQIVLRDILKCSVQVHRLSSATIARFAQNCDNSNQNVSNLSSNQLDHNYSRASLVSFFSILSVLLFHHKIG